MNVGGRRDNDSSKAEREENEACWVVMHLTAGADEEFKATEKRSLLSRLASLAGEKQVGVDKERRRGKHHGSCTIFFFFLVLLSASPQTTAYLVNSGVGPDGDSPWGFYGDQLMAAIA
jgi:hypothetical protein